MTSPYNTTHHASQPVSKLQSKEPVADSIQQIINIKAGESKCLCCVNIQNFQTVNYYSIPSETNPTIRNFQILTVTSVGNDLK